ncbi:MAG: hypothetical protein U0694_08105 [Anaerolineae bacterium]
MNAPSRSNPARPLIVLLLLLGIAAVTVGLAFPYFNISNNILSFDLTQVFWVGVFFIVVGLALWLLPLLANSRNIALLIIAIGLVGMGVALVYTYASIADNFLSFNLSHIFWLGVVYVVVGLILLFFTRGAAAPERPPMVREAKPNSVPPRPESRQERPTAAGIPKAEAVAFAPRPTPDDLTVIEGIGPRVQEALNRAGVLTYSQLAHMTAQEIYQVVKVEQGVRIVGDTATWAKQAQYIVDGDMPGLKVYQTKLIAGREEKK